MYVARVTPLFVVACSTAVQIPAWDEPLWIGGEPFEDRVDFVESGQRCGTQGEAPWLERSEPIALHGPTTISRAQFDRSIDVHVHVIHDGPVGELTEAQVEAQIAVLDGSFAPLGWSFQIASIDWTEDADWFRMAISSEEEHRAKSALKRGAPNALDLYTANPAGGMLGWASYPWAQAGDPVADGVVVLWDSLPGGAAWPYNRGDAAVHEVGHWLGLLHTFEGGCEGRGDQADDTPAEGIPAIGCPVVRDSCGLEEGEDPIDNFMNYVDDACMNSWTEDQGDRIGVMFERYRASR